MKSVFNCQNCGYQSPKWLGRCPDCGKWNCFEEEAARDQKVVENQRFPARHAEVFTLDTIPDASSERVKTGIDEFDRVLGGGIVPASVILLGGEPGIGKSTLLLQIAKSLQGKQRVLYVAGEESPQQLKMRAERLGMKGDDNFFIYPEVSIELVLENIERLQASIAIIDSVQTMSLQSINSAPGTVTQIRECTQRLVQFAKTKGVSLFIVGHVTKEGVIAGPKLLEHMVDTVIYFEGERKFNFRLLRTVKNRFGPTNEIGIFQMTSRGLEEVKNPAELFTGDQEHRRPGVQVSSSLEGTRPILVELESLTTSSAFGNGRRLSQGIDVNRLCMIIAVIEKHMGIRTGEYDIYLNLVGGLKVSDPAVDLAAALAVYSALKDREPKALFSIGELSLSSMVCPVPFMEDRIAEGVKLGYDRIVLPKSRKKLRLPQKKGVVFHEVSTLQEAVRAAFE
ncbi:MAG: DNA repair protein RadA [Candidatus Wallbacteria bacterium]|nr:DNA repair protein RadA [Candidatus Wallbacteria bacterium]